MGRHGIEGGTREGLAGGDETCELTTAAVCAKVAAEGTPAVMVADGGERALGVFACMLKNNDMQLGWLAR